MKRVGQLIDSTLQTPSEPSTKPAYTDEQKQAIKELFLLMKATWAHKYTSNFKTPEDVRLAMCVWLETFHSIDNRTLRAAVLRLSSRLEWPPTIQQMKHEVKLIEHERRVPTFVRLPGPTKPRSSRAAQELAKMQALLKGRPA